MSDEPNINEFSAQLTYAIGKGLTTDIKNKIQQMWQKRQYGVTLLPDEAESLKKIAQNEFYLLFKKYLGAHWSIKLIKVGIYISELNDDGKRKRAKELQSEVYRSYGQKGVKIIQLASTGVLTPIMDYLIDLRLTKGANPIVLHQEFDLILHEWDVISIPVRPETPGDTLKISVQKRIDEQRPIFFVYAAASASSRAQLTLAQMNNDGAFRGKYLVIPKIKVIHGQEYCLWILERVQDLPTTVISKGFGN